jgi:MurNAc alpha-1-phosphate uridylyltransferase
MIFAAGLGTRMGALTRHRPKPLIEVAGKPLIEHALALVRDAGIERIVVNTHAHSEQLTSYLNRAAPFALVSHESKRLETGGGLKQALPLLGPGPVFTLNADMVWSGPNPLELLAAAWDSDSMDGLLCLIPRDRAHGHSGPGDFDQTPEGCLSRRGSAKTAGYVYSGVQILKTSELGDIEDKMFSLNRVWDTMLRENRLYGIPYPGLWVDVGRPEGIALAEAELSR